MKKQDLIDAVRAFGATDEEINSLNMSQLGELLAQLRKNKELEDMPNKPEGLKTIEVTRSFSRKVNLGNYESQDFFCSRKAEVTEDDDIQAISNYLAYECKIDVETAIQNNYKGTDKIAF